MADLLFELGSEELPAGFVEVGTRELRDRLVLALAGARLTHGAAAAYGTPRRLAVIVKDVAQRQPDLDKEVLGPPVKAAFDGAGKPTQAAVGFARVNGLEVETLKRVATPKGEYLSAQVHETGKTAAELLPALLRKLIGELPFPKAMRWGDFAETYARPLLWILALHGEQAIELAYAGIQSGHHSRGHRFLAGDNFTVRAPGDYLAALRARKVEPDGAVRRSQIKQQLDALAAKAGCTPSAESEKALLDQVANLVEWPTAVLGSFEEPFLEIPREVLLSELTVHQRYFGLDRGGKLANQFAVIAGTPVKDEALSRHGYERVLRARLSDARFFFDEDRKQTLDSRVASLGLVVFQHKLGTVLEKAERVVQLADFLAQELKLGDAQRQTIARAARLAKADLVTGMVGEFPELQGIMGGYYAAADGEPAAVAAAIRDQYLPKFVGDALPDALPAVVIGIADRLDTLAGLFGIGKPPTGSADPFALRRACLGILTLASQKQLRFSLERCLGRALELLGGKISEAPAPTLAKLREFFRARLKVLFTEEFSTEVAEAVLGVGFDDLWQVRRRAEAVAKVIDRDDFQTLAAAFKRTASILEKLPPEKLRGEADPEKFLEAPERALWKSYLSLRVRIDQRIGADDYQGALEELASLKPAIDLFFDKVLVMADDSAVRENRFLLLAAIRALFGQVADLSQIQREKSGEARP